MLKLTYKAMTGCTRGTSAVVPTSEQVEAGKRRFEALMNDRFHQQHEPDSRIVGLEVTIDHGRLTKVVALRGG